MGVSPTDWRVICIVPLYKEKGDKYECSIWRGNRLLSVIGKLYGSVKSDRVRTGTECSIREEQCGLRQGRACKEQVQMCVKYLANEKYVFWVLICVLGVGKGVWYDLSA